MFRTLTLEDLGGGLNYVDVGARDGIGEKWKRVERHINLIGFELDAVECERLNRTNHGLNSVKYLPKALSGSNGTRTLYKTKNPYCSSLLEPDLPWLQRFSFGRLFELEGTQEIETTRLDDIEELRTFDTDVMKIDAQGLDLEILSSGESMLNRCFAVEIEPGFCKNYVGEYPYSDVEAYLRSQGFLLFDMNLKRVGRNNIFGDAGTGKEQILWCETLWFKDVPALAASGRVELSRPKLLKALLICALENCLDYGYELAELGLKQGLLTNHEMQSLRRKENWALGPREEPAATMIARTIGRGLRLLPRGAREVIAGEVVKPHLFKAIVAKRPHRREDVSGHDG
jgi:FkbM family methyltransferase